MIVQPQPIMATVGDDITLPCHVKPATDAFSEMLEWSRADLNPRFVHVRRFGEDHLVDQNPAFKGRTSVSIDGLKHGETSLKLSKVKLSDEGTYKCFIPGLNTESSVQLVVADIVIEITKVGSGELGCKSKGWYPEPEVFWLDGEGNLLSAGPTETVKGPDDLYTVSSRVTVEKRHSNSFTCRVQQKDINQTRETHIQVPDDFFMDSSSSSASTIIGLIVGILFILVVAFVVWKWRQNKINTKKLPEDEETQIHRETAKTETVKNQNKVEEENHTECFSEETGLLCQTEEETNREKFRAEGETNNILPQGQEDTEKQSIDAGTLSQFVMEDRRQRHDVQTRGETTNDLDNRDEETKSVSGETQTPGPAERETQQEHPETIIREETKSVNTEAGGQGLMDGGGQQQQVRAGGGTTNGAEKKYEENKIQCTNNKPEVQDLTERERQKGDLPAGVTENAADGNTDQLPEAEEQRDLKKKDEDKETKTTNNETAAQGPAEEERQQDELQTGGERKPEETKPPGPPTTETHTEQQTVEEKEESPDSRDREEDGISQKEKTITQSLNELPAGQAKRDVENTEDREKTGPSCPAEGGGQQEKNGDRRDGGENTTSIPGNTTHQSAVDGNTDQLAGADEQSDLDKKDEDKETKTTSNETAAQAPAEGESQQVELQTGGERKPEETKPPGPPTTETHTEQQTVEEKEESPDSRDREEDGASTQEDTTTQSLNEK
ncbi:uncharacterized protein DDB_G0283697-like [Micropterus salmoides]|uniref:uncharacterized protein DDB_G0283697-like n=1 Tax=Micropterus salmoides TaxID=27706 RepID=UPI0018EA8251|nr:uncharacterized protein DDB_G0283697-like [Micropterus salmoides]